MERSMAPFHGKQGVSEIYEMKLSAYHIVKHYGDHQVLNDVSFELPEGKVCVLMGTNGSGKTTLFNILTGFVAPDSGNVLLDGISVDKLKPFERCLKGIGRTFQDLRLINDLTIKENVLLAFSNQKGEKWWNTLLPLKSVKKEQQENLQEAEKILSQCFLDDVADSKAGEISYGQQKLLNIACCIAGRTKVLLLDEPVAGVNPVFREKLSKVITQLKSEGKTLLIIEHNSDFIEAVADEILFLHNGTLKYYDSYNDFRKDKEVLEAYI